MKAATLERPVREAPRSDRGDGSLQDVKDSQVLEASLRGIPASCKNALPWTRRVSAAFQLPPGCWAPEAEDPLGGLRRSMQREVSLGTW